jgi:hypothetical protein
MCIREAGWQEAERTAWGQGRVGVWNLEKEPERPSMAS